MVRSREENREGKGERETETAERDVGGERTQHSVAHGDVGGERTQHSMAHGGCSLVGCLLVRQRCLLLSSPHFLPTQLSRV